MPRTGRGLGKETEGRAEGLRIELVEDKVAAQEAPQNAMIVYPNCLLKPTRRLRMAFALLSCLATLFYATGVAARETVRAELIRLQQRYGLTFGYVDKVVQAVSFKKGSEVPLKDSLNVFQPDGFSWEKYPSNHLDFLCWSHDQSKVAGTAFRHGDSYLEVFELASKTSQVVESLVQHRMHFTSQCWSPDDKQVAYEVSGNVRVFDLNGGKPYARELARGTDVTWSPDGNWIAFRDGHTYYAIHANGEGRKKLFTKGSAVSALYWSPDSRIVAYVGELGPLQGSRHDAEAISLQFRRLEDNSECRTKTHANWNDAFHWFTTPELVEQSKSQDHK